MSARSEISPRAAALPLRSSRSTGRRRLFSTSSSAPSRRRPARAKSRWCRRARPTTACAAISPPHADGATTSIVLGLGCLWRRPAPRLPAAAARTRRPGANAWAAADDQILRRIAQTGIEQLALFIATARPPSGPATAEAPAAPPQRSSTFAWLDDWTPEASGIFRIFRRGPQPEVTADASADLPPAGQVPLPRDRPNSGGAPSAAAFAFAPGD